MATRPDLILFMDDVGDLLVKVVVCRVLSIGWLEACIVVADFGLSRGSPTFPLISRMACSIPWSVSGLGMRGSHPRKFMKEEISRTTQLISPCSISRTFKCSPFQPRTSCNVFGKFGYRFPLKGFTISFRGSFSLKCML